MAFNLPPPPVGEDITSPVWRDWFFKLRQAFIIAGSISWSVITGTPTTLTGYGITSPLPTAEGGTGLATIGTAGQRLTVNAGATALEYQTPTSRGTPRNVLTANTTVDADTSYVVTGYLDLDAYTLTLDGNLEIT